MYYTFFHKQCQSLIGSPEEWSSAGFADNLQKCVVEHEKVLSDSVAARVEAAPLL
jgi:hypothetical protein